MTIRSSCPPPRCGEPPRSCRCGRAPWEPGRCGSGFSGRGGHCGCFPSARPGDGLHRYAKNLFGFVFSGAVESGGRMHRQSLCGGGAYGGRIRPAVWVRCWFFYCGRHGWSLLSSRADLLPVGRTSSGLRKMLVFRNAAEGRRPCGPSFAKQRVGLDDGVGGVRTMGMEGPVAYGVSARRRVFRRLLVSHHRDPTARCARDGPPGAVGPEHVDPARIGIPVDGYPVSMASAASSCSGSSSRMRLKSSSFTPIDVRTPSSRGWPSAVRWKPIRSWQQRTSAA